MRLVLICHAATAATRAARFPADEPIEAGALPLGLAPSPAGRWLVAPERRALGTAQALAPSAALSGEAALRDWDCGRWRGRTLAELGEQEPAGLMAWLSDAAAAPHGGETLLELLARVEAWLENVARVGEKTTAVTHPAILRAAVVGAVAAGPDSFWRIDAPPLGRARLSHDGRRWTLQGLVPPQSRG